MQHGALQTVAEMLNSGERALRGRSDTPRLDAELLLCRILGLSRSELIARDHESVAVRCAQTYAGLLAQRLNGAPIAYLTGTREFWSLRIRVTPAVLVPRPDTETLVELALQRIPRASPRTVLDLGTGSGAIAIAIASERPMARLTGVDISAPALAIARQNAHDLGFSQIDWRLGSWYAPVAGDRFDVIVANPPYIAAADPALAQLSAEPEIALCSGPTGLEALTMIADNAAEHLSERGLLILEHGSGQAAAVAQLLRRNGFTDICAHLDLAGKARVTLGIIHSPP